MQAYTDFLVKPILLQWRKSFVKKKTKGEGSTLTPFLWQQSLQQKQYEETAAWGLFLEVPVTCFMLIKFSIILKMIQ